MRNLTETAICKVLAKINVPHLGCDLIAAKSLKKIAFEDGLVSITLRFGYALTGYHETLIQSIHNALQEISQQKVKVIIESRILPHIAQGGKHSLLNIKNIIAVASGKGGVGKSTVAVNLALALQLEGAKVGLLDADIYGPSQPHFLGCDAKPIVQDNKRLKPIIKYGLQTMSIGYLVKKEDALIWRGPMVSSALQQLLNETDWQALDYLVLDLPPGTGDIHLTLAQKIPVQGVVIVTTPQTVALLDAEKAVMMFEKLGIKILGVLENMGSYICEHCQNPAHIFGQGGGNKLAEQHNFSFLGAIPLNQHIQEQGERGEPIVVAEPSGKIAIQYREIARQVGARLALQPRDPSAILPEVVIQDY